MQTTRRLSLTLLLVAPLISAQDTQGVDLSLSSVSGEHLPQGRPRRPRPDYDELEDLTTTTTMDDLTTTQLAVEEVASVRKGESLSLSSGAEDHLPLGLVRHDDQETRNTVTAGSTSTLPVDVRVRRRRGGLKDDEDMETAEQVVFRPYFRNRQNQADRKTSQDADVKKQSLEAYRQAYPYLFQFYPPGAVRSR